MLPANLVSTSLKELKKKKTLSPLFFNHFYLIKKFLYFILPAGWTNFKKSTIDLWEKP